MMAFLATTETIFVQAILLDKGHAFPVVVIAVVIAVIVVAVIVVVVPSVVPNESLYLKKTQCILQSLRIMEIGRVRIQMPICLGGF